MNILRLRRAFQRIGVISERLRTQARQKNLIVGGAKRGPLSPILLTRLGAPDDGYPATFGSQQ